MEESNIARLYDVFISGPTQIGVSFYMKEPFLRCFMLLTGVLNILYNGHNYLRMKNPSHIEHFPFFLAPYFLISRL